MQNKKTIKTRVKEDEPNASLYIVSRIFLSAMAEKHKVDANKLLIGMQYGDLVVQVYDEGDSPKWHTLEVITF